MSTIAFTVCFAVWTIFSIIGVQIKKELGLNETQFGLLVGTPILTGSLIRIFLGIWTDQYGGRIVYTLTMLAAAVATFLLTYATTYPQMLVAALGVGIAGGSFAVGIAYVSRWYSTEKQGTALGIFGAGNVGAAVTKFLAPFVLVAYGWHVVAEVWAVGIALMGIVFWFTTKDDPVLRERRAKGLKPKSAWLELEPLKNVQVWRFSLYYFFVFGAFVALALWPACLARRSRSRPASSAPMVDICPTSTAHGGSCTGPSSCRCWSLSCSHTRRRSTRSKALPARSAFISKPASPPSR